jgi:outer membrane protein OmpA-like peptidoglycan-associated protein
MKALTRIMLSVVLATALSATAQEARDLLIVTSVLDFSVEGLKEQVGEDEKLAFRIVLPKKGVVRGEVLTQLRSGAGGAVAFQETYLYDASTFGNKHLVYVDAAQLPGVGSYELVIEVGGVRTDEAGKQRVFKNEKRFPVAIAKSSHAPATKPTERRLKAQVTFDYDSFVVRSSELSKIKEVAEAFKGAGARALLIVEGHTDKTGSAGYNLDLSVKRAIQAKRALVDAGIRPALIRTYGYGFERLLDKKKKGAAERNRRVEFVIVNTR